MGMLAHAASNLIFYGQQPLVKVSAKGEFSSFALGHYDTSTGEDVIDQRLARKISTLWYYPAAGPAFQVRASIRQGWIGCDKALIVKSDFPAVDTPLLTLRPLRGKVTTTLRQPDRSQLQQGKQLLTTALQRANLSAATQASVLEQAQITPVVHASRQLSSLVIAAAYDNDTESVNALLIATRDKHGHYGLISSSVETGTASDSDGYAGRSALVLHADLNGDGTEELLLNDSAYESFGVNLLQWDGSQWQAVAGNGGGC